MATKTQKHKKKKTVVEFPKAVIRQMLTLSTSGFGLVTALAWNNVIQEFVNNYVKKFFPTNSSLISLFLYAIIVTILAVLVTFQLSKVLERLDSK